MSEKTGLSDRPQALLSFSRIASVMAIALGGLSLVGLSVLPAAPQVASINLLMLPIGAINAILLGLSLWLLQTKDGHCLAPRLARIFALISLTLATLTLGEYLFSIDLGLDHLLLYQKLSSFDMPFPGRMPLQIVFTVISASLALLLIDVQLPHGQNPTEILAFTSIFIPFLTLLGYFFGITYLYRLSTHFSVPVFAVLAFALISAGTLCARPGQGLMGNITSDSPGGTLLRRMLPAAFGLPILLGWMRLTGESLGLYDQGMGLALMTAALAIVSLGFIWWNAGILNQAAAERQKLSETLQGQYQQLQELDRLKTNFVNTVSHELRTPLMSIVGYAEFLEEEIGGTLSPQQIEYVRQILHGEERLKRLVDDLLDFARLGAGVFPLSCSETDLIQRIQLVINSLQPQILEKGLRVTTELQAQPLMLRLDPGRIEQVLINLVNNALKFTPPGGTVAISVHPGREEVRVEVRDTGIGIAPEHMTHLFEKFYQVDSSTTREKGGAGLGLAISKALIELHGGHMGAESELGRGSVFWFTLPLVPLSPDSATD